MPDEDRIRLLHMIEAAESALSFVSGRQRADLDRDRLLLFGVVRAIEILGEAAGKVSEGHADCRGGGSVEWHHFHAQSLGPCVFRDRPRYCVGDGD